MIVFFKQKTAYEMRISDWSSDVCSSDLPRQLSRLGVCVYSATQLRRLDRQDFLTSVTGSTKSHDNVPDSHGSPDEPWLLYSTRQRAAFLGVLFLVGASNNTDRNILGVLLPQIKAEFVLSDTELGLLSGVVFAFFYATLGLPLARWADRGHRPRILTLSLLVWSAMTTLCGFAQSFWQQIGRAHV